MQWAATQTKQRAPGCINQQGTEQAANTHLRSAGVSMHARLRFPPFHTSHNSC